MAREVRLLVVPTRGGAAGSLSTRGSATRGPATGSPLARGSGTRGRGNDSMIGAAASASSRNEGFQASSEERERFFREKDEKWAKIV